MLQTLVRLFDLDITWFSIAPALPIILPLKSDSTFFFAGSVLVFGREQLPP
jgi:hypothetical protein